MFVDGDLGRWRDVLCVELVSAGGEIIKDILFVG